MAGGRARQGSYSIVLVPVKSGPGRNLQSTEDSESFHRMRRSFISSREPPLCSTRAWQAGDVDVEHVGKACLR
jgi:hypothetical protein